MEKDIYQKIISVVNEYGFKYNEFPEDLSVVCESEGIDMPIIFIVSVDPDCQEVRTITKIPFQVPEDKRLDFAFVLASFNERMNVMVFDYDINTGDIYVRVGTGYFGGCDISEEIIASMVISTETVLDNYQGKLLKLANGDITLEEFINCL